MSQQLPIRGEDISLFPAAVVKSEQCAEFNSWCFFKACICTFNLLKCCFLHLKVTIMDMFGTFEFGFEQKSAIICLICLVYITSDECNLPDIQVSSVSGVKWSQSFTLSCSTQTSGMQAVACDAWVLGHYCYQKHNHSSGGNCVVFRGLFSVWCSIDVCGCACMPVTILSKSREF